MTGEKFCELHPQMGELCKLLQNSDGIFVNQILHGFLEEYDSKLMEEHYRCAEANCGIAVFERFFSYLKIFKDVPEIQDRINSNDFPSEVLEKFVLFLQRKSIEEGEDSREFIENYLGFLTTDKIVEMIATSKYLVDDSEFLIHILARLDNKSMDALLARTDTIKSSLIKLFIESPEEEISKILFRNPILYDYMIMFLELEGRMDDSQNFSDKYESVIEDAKRIRDVVQRMGRINDNTTDQKQMSRGERIAFIVREISNTIDPLITFDIVVSNDLFLDERELQTVRMLLKDSRMQEYLHI